MRARNTNKQKRKTKQNESKSKRKRNPKRSDATRNLELKKIEAEKKRSHPLAPTPLPPHTKDRGR
nr:MAG TPA: hypothetical protein [Caudoviricetes sp.]